MTDYPNKNTGLIVEPPKPKDWIFGATAKGIEFKQRIKGGDWRGVKLKKELQSVKFKYDTQSCATFSALNSFEKQVNWMHQNKLIPEHVEKKLRDLGFFDINDEFNCSDWFTAVMSGTTANGNTLNAVWESIRTVGVIPQSKGIEPNDVDNINDWLSKSRVTVEQLEIAKKSLEIFQTNYEWLVIGTPDPDKIAKHLEHAPIHIGTAVCSGWSKDTPVKACNEPLQHATCAQYAEVKKVTHILDHYDPEEKQLEWAYPIPLAIKGVVTLQAAVEPEPEKPMILPDTKKVLIINAGHHNNDSGAVYNGIVERDECKKVRDAVVPILIKRGYKVHSVPDDLTLTQSIDWANEKAPSLNDGLAIDIHFNYLSNLSVGGTEAFHGTSETSKQIAATLSRHVAESLDTRDRGAKPDTQSAVGSLAWIRQTKMWATLLEVCFITNAKDMAAIKAPNGYQSVAEAMADAIDQIYGNVPPAEPEPTPEPPEEDTETPAENDPVILKTFTEKQLLEELLKRQK